MRISDVSYKPFDAVIALMVLTGIAGLVAFGMVMLAHPERSLCSGDVAYVRMARTITAEGPLCLESATGSPELHRTPGYPLFLAAVAPWRGMGGLRLLLMLQALLTLGTAVLLTDTARCWCGPERGRKPLVAGALWLSNPAVLVLAYQVLSEILFVFLLVLSLWVFVRGLRTRQRWSPALAGMSLGASILVRPIGLVLIPAAVGAWVVGTRRTRSAGEAVPPRMDAPAVRRGHLIPWIAGVAVLPGLWLLHNGVDHGYWGISKTGVSFAYSAYGEPYLAARVRTEGLNAYDTGEVAAGGALTAVASSILKHPGAFARTWLEGAFMTALGPGEWTMRRALLGELATRPGTPLSVTTISQSDQGLVFETGTITGDVKPQPRTPTVYLLVLWSVAVTAVTYIAALKGAVAGLRRRDPLAAFCVLAILLLLVGSSGYQAHARFRVPMIPYLTLLATLARPPARHL